ATPQRCETRRPRNDRFPCTDRGETTPVRAVAIRRMSLRPAPTNRHCSLRTGGTPSRYLEARMLREANVPCPEHVRAQDAGREPCLPTTLRSCCEAEKEPCSLL